MKRRIGVVIGVVALVASLVWWWSRGEDTPRGPRVDGVASAVLGGSSARSIERSAERVDPRTQPRGSIAGTVRDEASAPIAGARVCADLTSHELPAELTRDPLCVTTDARGAYTLNELLAGTYTVVGGARTYIPATYHPDGDRRTSTFPLAAGQARTGVDLVLRTGGVELTGVVSDVSGGPIAGARVRALAGYWGQFVTSPVVETDEEGAFSIWVRAGQVRVNASAEGYGDASELGHAPGAVELLLTPESSLSGIVVDATSGAPIEGAHVEVATGWYGEDQSTRSDAEGRFRVTKLTPGRYTATARTDRGHGRADGSSRVGLGEHVEGVVVRLHPAARITGTVKMVGATPTTCTEARVSFRDNASERFARSRTEPDGTVVADGVLPGTYVPHVQCKGWAPRETYEPIVVADQDVTDLVWEVEPGATIRGHVRTRDGAALEGALVSASSIGGGPRAATRRAGDTSGPDGGFVLDGLRAGTYRLELRSDRGLGPENGVQVEVAAGQVIERDLVVDPGGAIRGTVVDATGAAVPGVQVRPLALGDKQPSLAPARTDHAGAFTLEPLPAGTYRVMAQRGYGEPLRKPGTTDDQQQGEKATVTVGQTTTVQLVVEPLHGTIRGVVVDADGAPVIDAYVSAARESDAAGAQARTHATRGWGRGDQNKPVLTATDGTFTLEELAPGSYTVRAYRKGGGEAITEHVAVGTTTRLQIQGTGAIEGIARVEDGTTPDQISVVVRDNSTGFHRDETFLRTGGRFAIHELPAGHLVMTITSKAGRASVELDLADGETRRGVTVVLAGLVTLTGRVVELGTEQPIAGFTMAAKLADGGSSFGWGSEDRAHVSDASGRFTIARAPTGKIELFGFPKDMGDSEHEYVFTTRTVTGTGTIDLGDILVLRKRLKGGQVAGELGVRFKEHPPGTPPDQARLEVSYIDPAGPAARSGLVVGDVITSIDDVDVTGANASRAYSLMRAPAGTRLALGLQRGATVTVTLASP